MMAAPEASPTTQPPTTTSEATARAVAFVAAHRDAAEAIGAALAEFTNDPDAFAAALTTGLAGLADPEYLAGQRRVAPVDGHVEGGVAVVARRVDIDAAIEQQPHGRHRGRLGRHADARPITISAAAHVTGRVIRFPCAIVARIAWKADLKVRLYDLNADGQGCAIA